MRPFNPKVNRRSSAVPGGRGYARYYALPTATTGSASALSITIPIADAANQCFLHGSFPQTANPWDIPAGQGARPRVVVPAVGQPGVRTG